MSIAKLSWWHEPPCNAGWYGKRRHWQWCCTSHSWSCQADWSLDSWHSYCTIVILMALKVYASIITALWNNGDTLFTIPNKKADYCSCSVYSGCRGLWSGMWQSLQGVQGPQTSSRWVQFRRSQLKLTGSWRNPPFNIGMSEHLLIATVRLALLKQWMLFCYDTGARPSGFWIYADVCDTMAHSSP